MCSSPTHDSSISQIGAEVEAKKKLIEELKATVKSAQEKQKTSNDEVKRLEKDMDEFKNNKEGKIDEVKVNNHFLRPQQNGR